MLYGNDKYNVRILTEETFITCFEMHKRMIIKTNVIMMDVRIPNVVKDADIRQLDKCLLRKI